MEIPEGFRRVLPHRTLMPRGGPYKYCRICTHNVALHRLSEKPWRCRFCDECSGLETDELDAMLEDWLARAIRARRPTIPTSVRNAVLERDGMTCRYCSRKVSFRSGGSAKLNFDHVIPYSRGGPTTVDNIVVCCRRCNHAKKDFDLEEWLEGETVRFGIKVRLSLGLP